MTGADGLSGWLRRRLEKPLPARAPAIGLATTALGLTLAGAVAASFVHLDLGFTALFTAEAASAVGEFIAGFFPPDLDGDWLLRVARASWETLAIPAVGTLLAAIAGLALAQVRPASGPILNVLRSVPELVWATVTALAVGLGPFAGVLALALHTAGVLGRLYAEALENAPQGPQRALQLAGAPRSIIFFYAALPEVAPQLLAYTLYRWEMNIRMAAILGFVGAGGLGQLLYVELSLFRHAQASTVIMAMLALSVAVDWTSAWLRHRAAPRRLELESANPTNSSGACELIQSNGCKHDLLIDKDARIIPARIWTLSHATRA